MVRALVALGRVVLVVLVVLVVGLGPVSSPAHGGPLSISELRVDQPGSDVDEYIELVGTPGVALDDLTCIVLGDGPAGCGVVEAVIPLDGVTMPASGYLLIAESTFTLGAPDVIANLAFENNDTVTHLLVHGWGGSITDDLDLDDDGVLDAVPWNHVLDRVALRDALTADCETAEHWYAPDVIGPGGDGAPHHGFRCLETGVWVAGGSDPADGLDTPGGPNPACPPPGDPLAVQIAEIRIDQPGADTDEYIELAGDPFAPLDGVTYLVIGDGADSGSGHVEFVLSLTGHTLDEGGRFVVAESTFTLGVPDLVTPLNFENSDNVTHALVVGFGGALDDDLDRDDDGVLDTEPWKLVLDIIALVENAEIPPVDTEWWYGPVIGPTPDDQTPGHVHRCRPTGTWTIGATDPARGTDSPGVPNPACDGPSACDADLDGDALVDAHDLAMLLGAWGEATGHAADLDGNGVVGSADLDLLLAAWGACP